MVHRDSVILMKLTECDKVAMVQHAQSSYNDNTSKQSFGYATSNARAGGNGAHSPQPPQRSTAVNRQARTESDSLSLLLLNALLC